MDVTDRSVNRMTEIKLLVGVKNDNVIAVGSVWRPDNKVYILLLYR